ncbi:MAG: hypothetical protein JWR18_2137 [Segetibacter sp.]|jgi:hypothetical protein|nr:hypothetical protein [Segetibacter sp.]
MPIERSRTRGAGEQVLFNKSASQEVAGMPI